MTSTLRAAVVAAADWCVPNKGLFDYLESRPFPLFRPSLARRIANDCSATSVLCCWLAKAPEPFPGAYTGTGNTESFLTLPHVPAPAAGDFVVYGEGLSLSVQHMAVVVEVGPDPLTMSHGGQSEPAFVRVSQGCPPAAQGRVIFVRYLPLDPPVPKPSEDTVGRRLVQDPTSHGWWLVDEDRKVGIPNPTDLATLKAEGIPETTMSAAELAGLTTVQWGSL
ncbi:MAG: hypothetical protein JWO62_1158 [Acidimicrobiaceae bacterium]|nr:hypothetical protein [Acidimicrobiaceae bacterium]